MRVVVRMMLAVSVAVTAATCRAEGQSYDVVIYGGTSAAISTAVQVRRMGKTVVSSVPTSILAA